MKESFTRETAIIKTDLSQTQVWSLFNSLDFWLDNLPQKVTQLSLEGEIKAGAKGQIVFNGQTYTFNLLAWEKPHTISIKVAKESRGLFLLQINLKETDHITRLDLHLFNYTYCFWQRLLPGMNVSRWFRQLGLKLKQTLTTETTTGSRSLKPTKPNLPQGFYLWRKSNRYTRELKQVLKPFSLTPTQWFVLKAINDLNQTDQQLTHEDVAKALKLHPVVVSDMVKILVRKNLVRKLKPADNKRAFYLSLSPIGRQTLNLSLKVVKDFDQQFFA